MTEERPAPIEWSDAYLLGFGPMDDVHRDFVACVKRLQTAEPADMVDALRAVRDHAISHFDQENRWMEETDFPSRGCHIDEHAAVLKSLEQVLALLRTELSDAHVRAARALADELVRWFPGHADYLDSALSHWMCKRSLGGKPIVIRRDLTAANRPPAAD